MKISILSTFILWLALSFSQFEYQQLVGDWQLVYFDGIERIKSSTEYQSRGPEFRSGVEARIKFRLENTVYKFKSGDTLEYTDFVNQTIVMKTAKIDLANGNIITIHEEGQTKKAEIVALDKDRMVLQPISENGGAGNLIFERIKPERE